MIKGWYFFGPSLTTHCHLFKPLVSLIAEGIKADSPLGAFLLVPRIEGYDNFLVAHFSPLTNPLLDSIYISCSIVYLQ